MKILAALFCVLLASSAAARDEPAPTLESLRAEGHALEMRIRDAGADPQDEAFHAEFATIFRRIEALLTASAPDDAPPGLDLWQTRSILVHLGDAPTLQRLREEAARDGSVGRWARGVLLMNSLREEPEAGRIDAAIEWAEEAAAADPTVPTLGQAVSGLLLLPTLTPEQRTRNLHVSDSMLQDTEASERATGAPLGPPMKRVLTDPSQENFDALIMTLEARAAETPAGQRLAGAAVSMLGYPGIPHGTERRIRRLLEEELTHPEAAAGLEATRKRWEAEVRRESLVGEPLVIEGTLLDGGHFTSADWIGRVVLVDFWASWCGPCLPELPRIRGALDRFQDDGFEVIGVSCDESAEALQAFLAKQPGVGWPQLYGDPQPDGRWHPLALDLGVTQIPTMFLIDRRGVVRSIRAREDLEDLLPVLLAEGG